MAYLSKRHKIIVGVDFGTTFTGVCYANTAQKGLIDASEMMLIQDWPGMFKDSPETCKTPSRIAFSQENPKITSDKWGYEVRPGMNSYSWLKLGLDQDTNITDYDDPELGSLVKSEGAGMLKFPNFISPVDACAAFLSKVYTHIIEHIQRRFGSSVLGQTPIEFWFTVPAIWSDKARAATRQAALKAGFSSRKVGMAYDQIFMIPEPEAAAVAALTALSKGVSGGNQLKKGMGLLVCDCGGGTTDITTYEIKSVSPRLEFEELVVGIGGKTGSTSIDRHFHAWMSKTFGEQFDNLPFSKIGPCSRLMNEFELCKATFGNSTLTDAEFPIEFVMPGVKDSFHYDAELATITLYNNDMEGFFKPVVARITKLLKQQIEPVEAEIPETPITMIILVGGFGNSAHLFQELSKWCLGHGDIKLICPPHPQAAIVRGAALRGLEGLKPKFRKSRAFYGFGCSLPFREGTDPEYLAYHSRWYDAKYCKSRIDWQIKKGQVVDHLTVASTDMICTEIEAASRIRYVDLYIFSGQEAPDYATARGIFKIGQITNDLTDIDFKDMESKICSSGRLYSIEYRIEMLLRSDEGELQFRCIFGDKQLGTATITVKFAGHYIVG